MTRFLLTLLAPFFVASVATAQPAAAPAPAWKEGTDYELITPPVEQSVPGKVNVTEVFSYGCPSCNFSYPAIKALKKKQLKVHVTLFDVASGAEKGHSEKVFTNENEAGAGLAGLVDEATR